MKIIVSFATVAALVKFVGFFYSVLALVLLEIVSVNGRIAALVTLVGCFFSVLELVFYEVSILNGRIVTLITRHYHHSACRL